MPRGCAALLNPWKRIIWGAARRGGAAQRRRAARATGGSATARVAFLRKVKAGAGAHAMLMRQTVSLKGSASVRAARAALRFRACACEGSEAWRADTLCCVRENPY